MFWCIPDVSGTIPDHSLPSLPLLLLLSEGGCEALSCWQQPSCFAFRFGPKIDVSTVSSESSSEAQNPSFLSISACFYAFPMSQEPFPIILGTFGKKKQKFTKNVDFVRVSFQFLAQGLRAVWRIPGLTTCLDMSFLGQLGPTRAVGWRGRNLSKKFT